MEQKYDVAILGGGLAGLTLALQLKKKRPQCSIVVLEKGAHPAPEAAFKVGESTVEVAAHYFAEVLGLKEHIRARQLPKLGLRCFFQNSQPERLEHRVEFGSNSFFPRSTYQIDRGRFENHLREEVQQVGVSLLQEASVREVEFASEGHAVVFERSGESMTVKSRWVVDASGRAALFRKKLDIQDDCKHKVNAVWFRIPAELNIDEWGEGDDWRRENSGRTSRWFSTNHLMGEGYWVWIIPLASGSTSIGIVFDPRYHPLKELNSVEGAFSWLERNEPRCFYHVAPFRERLQDFLVLKHFSRQVKKVFSSDRWALTGDSGFFIDPLYSPGSDFIAYANTWITELIDRDLEGKGIRQLTEIYDELYRGFAENSFLVYQDQYPLFGNAVVMPLKIIWDFATYWSFFATLFTHDKLGDLTLYATVGEELRLVSAMNREMQEFFRELHYHSKSSSGGMPRVFLDIAKTFLFSLNQNLTRPMTDEEFLNHLLHNIRQLSQLGMEMVERSSEVYPIITRPTFAAGEGERSAYLEPFASLFHRSAGEEARAVCA